MRWVSIGALVAAGSAGVGWTINFAHRRAWPVMIALIGVPVVLAIVIARLAR